MAAGLMLASCGSKTNETTNAPAQAAPIVSVVSATAEDIDVVNTYTSNVEPFATNNIMPQTAGRIVNINVEVGNKVRKGQLLAKMDDVNLAKTRLQIVNDSTELSRLTELYKIGAVSQADYDLAKLSLEIARKTYSNLVENTLLRSPINGVVTARNFDKGDKCTPFLAVLLCLKRLLAPLLRLRLKLSTGLISRYWSSISRILETL